MRVLAIGLQLLALSGMAQEYGEYEVKAAYLYNFARFAKWPTMVFPEDSSLLVLCIIGKNPFGGALDALAGKAVDTHAIRIQHMTGLPGVAALRGCHLLFISRSEQGRLPQLLATLEGLPVLSVSDIDSFAQVGGMIGLVERDRRIHFDINLAVVQRSGIRLSSQLLKLARVFDE